MFPPGLAPFYIYMDKLYVDRVDVRNIRDPCFGCSNTISPHRLQTVRCTGKKYNVQCTHSTW